MIRYKSSLVSLGKGAAVSAAYVSGKYAFVLDNGNALLRRNVAAGGKWAEQGGKVISYAESCVLLSGGIAEYALGVRYEPYHT